LVAMLVAVGIERIRCLRGKSLKEKQSQRQKCPNCFRHGDVSVQTPKYLLFLGESTR
jgi:hypothetical protein